MTRTARVVEVTDRALVLGSTQPVVNPPGIDVVRRRSGGGAVLVGPGEVVWVDLLVPADDPLWEDDVGRSFHWLGRVWAGALAGLGVTDVAWHDGPLVCTPWCRQVCFAGLGPGEVTVAGRKVVGLAQRRTRAGALFQCAALLRWDPATMADLLALPAEAIDGLAAAATSVAVDASALQDAFLAALTRSPR
ncbi:MAG: biotin/lipoate protein ligase [Acidimicrobiales bacterium]|nr:biotin/lipoate protein ligase [Acidimicrobiales bacterium]